MSDTEQRTFSGSAIGTGAGAAVRAIGGHTVWGAAIGTAVGAAGGFLYDCYKKDQQKVIELRVVLPKLQKEYIIDMEDVHRKFLEYT